MGFFKKKPVMLNNEKDCCEPPVSYCIDLTNFSYDENTYILSITTDCGNTFTVDLSSLAPDGVIVSLVYDPVTGILTITTSLGNIYTTAITGTLTIANTVFVTQNGSDATGLRQRLDKPFKTPWAAIAAANPGDTVIVYPGAYVNTNTISTDYLAKDKVILHMYKGASITYSGGSPNTVQPLWDQGANITFVIRGNGVLNLATSGSTAVVNYMSGYSNYDIELDELLMSSRLFSTNGQRSRFKVQKITIAGAASFITWRNTVLTQSESIIDCEEFYHPSSSQVLTPIDHRNFESTGNIVFKSGTVTKGPVFTNTAFLYFSSCRCPVTVDIDRFVEPSAYAVAHYIGIFIGTSSPNVNVSVRNINATLGMWSFASAYSTDPTNGRIHLEGKLTAGAAVASAHIMATGSRLTLDYNLELTNDFTAYSMDFSNVQTTILMEGRIRYRTTQPAATSAPFRNNNSGGLAAPSASLHRLTVDTNTDYIMIGAGPTLANINCMSVYSNKGFNPALHAAAIEPITVSPAITL